MSTHATTDELRPGALVTKAVRLLRPLAEGGMGKVWVGEHLTLGTHVVVKFMSPEIAEQEGALERFTREATALAAVKSPNVVQVFDSGVTYGGWPYIVMELLDGHDLADHLAQHGPMTPDEAARVVLQIGRALAKAHRIGVVHRDIKPENIFLCTEDVELGEPLVKLLDFGTAKHAFQVVSTHTTGTLTGTPYYMSPEQILGQSTDHRTDIWSLGVVAYEALTGVKPFDGETIGAITLAIHSPPPSLLAAGPELSPALDAWFQRACAKDRDRRFASAREAADAFASAVAHGSGRSTISSIPASGFSLDTPPLRLSLPASIPHFDLAESSRRSSPPPLRAPIASMLEARPPKRRHLVSWVVGGLVCLTVGVMAGLVTQQARRVATVPVTPVRVEPSPARVEPMSVPKAEPAPLAIAPPVNVEPEPAASTQLEPEPEEDVAGAPPSMPVPRTKKATKARTSAPAVRHVRRPMEEDTLRPPIEEDTPEPVPTFEPRPALDPWATPHGESFDEREVKGGGAKAPGDGS